MARARLVFLVSLSILAATVLSGQDQGPFWNRWKEAESAKDWKRAELAMRDALKIFPNHSDFTASLVWALRQQKRPDEALALIEPLFRSRPSETALRESYAYTLLDVGWACYEKKDYGAALEVFGRAFAALPDNQYTANAYGAGLRDTGRLDEAAAILEKAYAAFPDYPYLKPNLSLAYVLKAILLMDAKDAAAESWFAKAGALDPFSEAYLLNYGRLKNALGRYDEALALFGECARRYPQNVYYRSNIQYSLQERERALAAAGNYRAALAATTEALRQYPGETWFILDAYEYCFKLADYAAADAFLRRLCARSGLLDYGKPLARDRDELVQFRLQAMVWKYAELGDFKAASALLDAVGANFPEAYYVHELRGILRYHSGDISGGIAAVNKVYDEYIRAFPQYQTAVTLPLPVRGTLLVWGNNRPDSITHAGLNRFCFDFLGADGTGAIKKPDTVSMGRNIDYYGFGRDIFAVVDGTVERADGDFPDIEPRNTPLLGEGNILVIKDSAGFHYNYAHIRKGSITVRVGQAVKAGQKIGELGNSGYTSVPHLHFGLYSPDWRLSIPVNFSGYEARKADGGPWIKVPSGVPETGAVIRLRDF